MALKYVFPFASVLLLIACTAAMRQKTEFYKPLVLKETYNYSSPIIDLKANPINELSFNTQVINYKNQNWYCFLKKTKVTLFLVSVKNPTQTDSLTLNVPDSIRAGALVHLKFPYLIYFHPEKSVSLIYKLIPSGVHELVNAIHLPKWDPKNLLFKNFGYFSILDSNMTKYIFNFGDYTNPKLGFLSDKYNFLALELNKAQPKYRGFYPKGFFSEKKYQNTALFKSDNVGNLYFTNEMHDSIYKVDSTGLLVAANILHTYPKFLHFNWKKEDNLAYVRNFSILTEINKYLHITSTGHIIVIKQLSKKTISEKSQYKYFVFDKNLTKINSDTIRHSCYPRFISNYGNGFLLLSDSLTKSYYYEIH